MVKNIYTLFFLMFVLVGGLAAQQLNTLGPTIRVSGEWEISDVWYDLPVDINLDGYHTKFAAIEYNYCEKYQTVDMRLLDGKLTHTIGMTPLCDQRQEKYSWHVENKEVKILDDLFDRDVIILKKKNKTVGQLVILDATRYELLVYGNMPKDKFAKPGFIHLSRVSPKYSMN